MVQSVPSINSFLLLLEYYVFFYALTHWRPQLGGWAFAVGDGKCLISNEISIKKVLIIGGYSFGSFSSCSEYNRIK